VTLNLLHDRLSVTSAFFVFVMAMWAVWLAARGRGVEGDYLGAVVIGEALLAAQALLGIWLWLVAGMRPERGLVHVLYGALVVLIWPFIFTFTRDASGRSEAVRYAVGSLFLWGLVMRAIDTGSLG
jgi:heme A synthase